jgi:Outer membrane protein beta-barrel domain
LKIGGFKILLSVILLWISLSSAAFAQSKNFEGFGLAIDYSLNAITDQSTPGGSETSNSGIPSITADYLKAISEQWLVGAYGTYDLVTTDTTGTDPDAHNPIEIGGKLGFALNEKLMAYAKLGYSASKYSSPGFYQWLHGSSYGIGAEYLLAKHLFARFEVSHQSYKTIYWSDGSSDKVWINSYGVSLGWKF